VTALAVLQPGCSGTRLFGPSDDTPHAQRTRRDAEVARRFSQRRDAAEFEEALSRWNEQDLRGCREALDRLLSRNPAHREARLLLADLLVAVHQPREALAEVQKALTAYPHDADVQYALALMLDANGRSGEALAYYEQAAKTAPDNEVYTLGYQTAREAADRHGPPATPANPSPPEPADKGKSAGVKAQDGGGHGPASARRPAGACEEGDPAARLQKGYDALALGLTDTALACFRDAAARDPHNPQILIDAATAALGRNQPRLAIDLLSPAAKQFATSAAVQRILGVAYYRSGDYPSSQVALRQALSLDKSSALSYFLMGCTLTKLGQLEAAETHFRQAQALDPRYVAQRQTAGG
jgi:tetratricopeptide (TPR) repeat protein